jgi:hypothetical protein
MLCRRFARGEKMTKLKVNFENCYGIKSLNAEFDFTQCKVHSIYAPNGSMKTSFSKTMNDFSKGNDSKDAVFSERPNKRDILDESGNAILREAVFVIEPYNKEFKSEKTSLLMVNPQIKSEYDAALSLLEDKKSEIIKQIKSVSGLTGRSITPETELLKVFSAKSIFDALENIPQYDSQIPIERLSQLVYANIFNEKTISFLANEENKKQIKEYIGKYEELVTKSPILNKTFNHVQAQGIQKNLNDSGFFSAKHSVSLFNGNVREEYTSSEELGKKIVDEKQKIFSDKDLEKKFDSIDKKLTNVDLKALRDYLYDNQEILIELGDIPKLQKNILISYLNKIQSSVVELNAVYKSSKSIIENAIKNAREEKTEWENVVNIFKKRFAVPFVVSIENQEEVILNETAPKLVFSFCDGTEARTIDSSSLIDVLSQGERRALYIMNILFEINARIKQGIESILIIDDIADSFDYKNKYAIIEYLREITSIDIFYTIFLTHNFDFHRTISSRLDVKRKCRYFIYRNDGNVKLSQELYQKSPFDHWKDHLDTPKFMLSAIPFVRNLAEYCGYTDVFNILTSTLHIKSDTQAIKISDIEMAFKSVLKDKTSISLPDKASLYLDVLERNTVEILAEPNESAELESKIILAIAIRIVAETYMIREINDRTFTESITSNQTMELFKRFNAQFPLKTDEIKLLEEVNIMTPENIHLNSFMYEPILDMSPDNLKSLYIELKRVLA